MPWFSFNILATSWEFFLCCFPVSFFFHFLSVVDFLQCPMKDTFVLTAFSNSLSDVCASSCSVSKKMPQSSAGQKIFFTITHVHINVDLPFKSKHWNLWITFKKPSWKKFTYRKIKILDSWQAVVQNACDYRFVSPALLLKQSSKYLMELHVQEQAQTTHFSL